MNIGDIEEMLSVAVSAHLSGNQGALLAAITEVGEPAELAGLIRGLVSDEARLAACATRSYQHPNSFSKIVLLAGRAPSWKLRMHLWWPRQVVPKHAAEHIHNHRWDFASVLLRGSYVAQEFVVDEEKEQDETGLYRYEYFSPEGGDAFRLVLRGRAAVRPVLHAILPPGTSYVIHHEILHQIVSDPSRLTATLFLQGPALTASTEVYARETVRTTPEGNVGVKGMQADRVVAELRRYLTANEQAGE